MTIIQSVCNQAHRSSTLESVVIASPLFLYQIINILNELIFFFVDALSQICTFLQPAIGLSVHSWQRLLICHIPVLVNVLFEKWAPTWYLVEIHRRILRIKSFCRAKGFLSVHHSTFRVNWVIYFLLYQVEIVVLVTVLLYR